MNIALLRNLSLSSRNFLSPQFFSRTTPNVSPLPPSSSPFLSSLCSKLRFFSSSDNDSSSNLKTMSDQPEKKDASVNVEDISNKAPETKSDQPEKKDVIMNVEDISNKELKLRIDKYFQGDEELLPSIFEAVLKRKLTGNHEDTDEELTEELQLQPLDKVDDKDVESDFEEFYKTDEDIDDLYNTREIVQKKMMKDEYFNMNDQKWDAMIKEATEKGFLKDTGECERILEDMLSWDKLLPDNIKKKVEEKFNELGDMCERGELEPEEAYELFKEFEDQMVLECGEQMETEGPRASQFDDSTVPHRKIHLDDPPGEGPILRWQTRIVFAPGGDAWHPKNRKVKMAVTVRELGLSKHQFRRLRELVGKRYHPGRDELTITSERFEHREENRKDCLRTLFSLLEEAGKANKLVEDARTLYVKDRLRANPMFMERLRAKTTRLQGLKAMTV